MKIQSFRIQNYKSILDSGICRLSDSDNICLLAGQNESGKSSVLQALYDFEMGRLRDDCIREFELEKKYPIIECTYKIERKDDLVSKLEPPEYLLKIIKALDTVTLIRKFKSLEDSTLNFSEDFEKVLIENLQHEESKIDDSGPVVEEDNSTDDITEEIEPTEDNDEENESTGDTDEDDESLVDKFLNAFFNMTPKIIFFDDFCDLLPKKIFISDLENKNTEVNGYNAVINIQKILDTDFTILDTLSDSACRSHENQLTNTITANFNERWKQKIFDKNEVQIAIAYAQGRKESPGAYLNFFIETKEGEPLSFSQRSKGLQWFLSFFLQLKAESQENDALLILFDEPGLYLHSKAQKDIKSLFEELSKKDQILYSTHSPYLIYADKIHRIRLVINDKLSGTTIDGYSA